MGNCKGLCEVPNKELFSKKATYKTHSYCRKCNIWVKQPTSSEIIVTTPQYREVSIWKVKVTCPCCLNQCSGGSYGKAKPKPDYSKSYKELGLKKTLTRGKPIIKEEIKNLLQINPLEILKEYDKMVFGLEPESRHTLFNEIVDRLKGFNPNTSEYDRKVTPDQQQRYQKLVIKELDKFARKNKIELFGMTKEEQKRESKKRLDESIRRQAEAEARGEKLEYVPFIDIPIEDKEEDETETNNANGH